MSSRRSISLKARMWIFQFDQVFLIPPALESKCLINSGLQSLTSGSELMSAFVWAWRQTKGKANPTIIIIMESDRGSEWERQRQTEEMKKEDHGYFGHYLQQQQQHPNKGRDECSRGRLSVDNAAFSFHAQSCLPQKTANSGVILWED